MKARVPQMVIKPDYRQFRLRKLNTPEFSHIKLLLFCKVYKLYGVAGNTDSKVCILFFLRMFHSVYKFFFSEYVNV